MKDQASTLRFIASTSTALPTLNVSSAIAGEIQTTLHSRPRYIAITGGKGGVGKSNLSVNLALELGALGRQIALLDGDFGLANADLLCGVTPKFHLGHVIKGLKELDEIIVKVSENVSLIPSGSGFEDLANLSLATHSYLFAKLYEMEQELDFMLIDTAAGIAESVAGVVISAEEIIVVVTPEPTSIVDAYATIKMILRHSPGKPVSIVVNSVVGVGDGEKVFQQIHSAVRGFLGHDVKFSGMIPHDSAVSEAVREQVPVVQYAPNSPASRAIRLIAKQFHSRKESASSVQAHSFWEMLTRN